jgi:hypothetical protein
VSTVATSRLWLTLAITATILYVLYTQVRYTPDIVAALAVAEDWLVAAALWK